jgi:hypothetical protein
MHFTLSSPWEKVLVLEGLHTFFWSNQILRFADIQLISVLNSNHPYIPDGNYCSGAAHKHNEYYFIIIQNCCDHANIGFYIILSKIPKTFQMLNI